MATSKSGCSSANVQTIFSAAFLEPMYETKTGAPGAEAASSVMGFQSARNHHYHRQKEISNPDIRCTITFRTEGPVSPNLLNINDGGYTACNDYLLHVRGGGLGEDALRTVHSGLEFPGETDSSEQKLREEI